MRLTRVCGAALVVIVAGSPAGAADLAGPEAFTGIADERARSVALFEEAGKVIQHPRCVNCHPRGDMPLQGEDNAPHQPPVFRGEGNVGVAGMHCSTCHMEDNVDHAGVPGHPKWHLAPAEMAWHGVPLAAICAQIKDTERNGGMSLTELHEHMAEDSLVGWGWAPDAGREPAPGDQVTFGRLIGAWIETGAHCPS